jgi:Tol biopolymer transport system component
MFFEYPVAVPAPDGAKVFAVGKEDVGRLVRYDVVRKRFVDFPGAIPAMQVDYSRDGLWLAYVNYSDNTLWKVRSDGIERTRLTQPDIEVGDPRWSPDGSQLAFMGRRGAGPYRVYLIGASGGKAVEVLQDGPDQGVPSWSPDGSALIFGDFRHSPPPAMCIHILDLKTRKVSIMPDSDGLWSPRLSPDGRFIAALSPDSQELKLRNSRSGDWQRVAAFSNIDYLYWTADSRYLHFRGAEGRPDSRRPFQRALYRVDPATRRLEKMLDLDHFSGTSVEWFGITPDGTPLGLAGEAIENIYAIAVPH